MTIVPRWPCAKTRSRI